MMACSIGTTGARQLDKKFSANPCLQRRAALAAVGTMWIGRTAAQPAGPAVSLRLIRPSSSGPSAQTLDHAALVALGVSTLTTNVPWDKDVRVWEGVRLRRVLDALQVAGRPVRLKALNDYEAVIPWNDLERYDPILAWHRDGQPIPVRHKGPLLVIYPFSAHAELRRSEYIDRSVWHVNEIVVE